MTLSVAFECLLKQSIIKTDDVINKRNDLSEDSKESLDEFS